jgi:hypothetical protein
VLLPLNELTAAVGQLASNDYYSGLAEVALTAAMGEVFRAVGMNVGQASAIK